MLYWASFFRGKKRCSDLLYGLRYRCDCIMASAKASSYTESLRDYLHGDEWRENVDIFIRSNCGQFRSDLRSSSDDHERSHKYYALWKTFQEIVESILEVALLTIGGSTTALEKALDDCREGSYIFALPV